MSDEARGNNEKFFVPVVLLDSLLEMARREHGERSHIFSEVIGWAQEAVLKRSEGKKCDVVEVTFENPELKEQLGRLVSKLEDQFGELRLVLLPDH